MRDRLTLETTDLPLHRARGFMRWMLSHRWSYGFVAASVLFVLPASASALTNGGFENGFTGWSSQGDFQVVTSSIGTTPTEGTHQALLASATDVIVTPGTGASLSTINTLLGLGATQLNSVGNGTFVLGSATSQAITLGAGETLSFDWDFMTNQTDVTTVPPSTNNNDFAFASILASSGPAQVTKLADTFSTLSVTPLSNPFAAETKYKTFSFTAATSGSYLLGVGVVHTMLTTDDGVNSGVLVDNVRVVAAPEPASWLAVAAIGLVLVRRRPAST